MTTTNRRRLPFAAIAAATLACLALLPGRAAASGPTFALEALTRGPYFVFDAQPGATLTGKVRVVNVGGAAGVVHLYAVDATTGQTSGAVYLTDAHSRNDVGAWTAVRDGDVALRPGQSRTVSFTVRVPASTRAGDHLGGIVADGGVHQTPAVRRHGSSFRINVRSLTVIAIEERVPGPRFERMSIDGVHAGGMRGYQELFVTLANLGNVLQKGSGSIAVSDLHGHVLKRNEFKLDTFVPLTKVDYPVFVRGRALAAGDYQARITLRYDGHVVTRTFRFKVTAHDEGQVFGSHPGSSRPLSSIPIAWLIAAAVALLALGFGLAALWFRRRERRIAAMLHAQRERDELDLMSLSAADAERDAFLARRGEEDGP
jgi:hypothetical protein